MFIKIFIHNKNNMFNILTNMYKSFAREQNQSLEDLSLFCVVRMKYLILWGNLVPQ